MPVPFELSEDRIPTVEECYLETIETIIDTYRVRKAISADEIRGICHDTRLRLSQAGSLASVEKFLALERSLLKRG